MPQSVLSRFSYEEDRRPPCELSHRFPEDSALKYLHKAICQKHKSADNRANKSVNRIDVHAKRLTWCHIPNTTLAPVQLPCRVHVQHSSLQLSWSCQVLLQ